MTQPQKQRHVMLSYEWNIQQLVVSIYDYLVQKQLPVWMDIKAGVTSANLYEGIGEAIENSTCFICFMTPEYQQSDFCKQELQYAKQRNIPIIPLKLEENWNPTSWLGLITAGLLWLDFYHIQNLEKKATQLYNRICTIVNNQLQLQNPHATKSTETETVVCASSPRALRIHSSVRQNQICKRNELEQNDLNSRHSVQDLLKQFSSKTFDEYQMNINARFKSPISQRQTSFRSKISPRYAFMSAYLDPTNDIFQKESKEISTLGSQDHHIRRRPSTTKIPPTNHYMIPTKKSSNDDDDKEEERNDSKFGP